MNLSVKEMLCGDPVRLRYVNRYSTCRVNHKETVAEHSYFVGLYSSMIGLWCTRQGHPVVWSLLMTASMIHDMEEARSGDWPRHFKHSDENLRENLDRVAETAMLQILNRLFECEESSDPFSLLTIWRDAKTAGLEGRIVAFADFLSVLSYISQEHLSGNTSATEHVVHLDQYFEEFRSVRYEQLRPLVDQAGELLRDLFADCRRSCFAGVTG